MWGPLEHNEEPLGEEEPQPCVGWVPGRAGAQSVTLSAQPQEIHLSHKRIWTQTVEGAVGPSQRVCWGPQLGKVGLEPCLVPCALCSLGTSSCHLPGPQERLPKPYSTLSFHQMYPQGCQGEGTMCMEGSSLPLYPHPPMRGEGKRDCAVLSLGGSEAQPGASPQLPGPLCSSPSSLTAQVTGCGNQGR